MNDRKLNELFNVYSQIFKKKNKDGFHE